LNGDLNAKRTDNLPGRAFQVAMSVAANSRCYPVECLQKVCSPVSRWST